MRRLSFLAPHGYGFYLYAPKADAFLRRRWQEDHPRDMADGLAARTRATRLVMGPGYYTDDPALDRLFGRRPQNYLARLGELLDPAVEVFWTGEEVCSREYSPGHLARVGGELRRKPFLWDNYPVNDFGYRRFSAIRAHRRFRACRHRA